MGMKRFAPLAVFCHFSVAMLSAISLSGALQAQDFFAHKTGPIDPPPPAITATVAPASRVAEQHKFWDRKNYLLFATVTSLSAADFVLTRDNLQHGGCELNPVTRVFGRSTPALAANFAGQSAAVIGAAYFFHKTGHHKLERMVSMVNAGASAAAVSFDLAHR